MPGFTEVFGFPAEANASAPGRVNLLGEHTDYNDGFVLPTAIPQRTVVELAVSPDERFHFHSENLGETVHVGADAPERGFATYVYGCVQVLRRAGHAVPAITVHVRSDVPIGAGLSSSAALEVATLRALRARFGIELDDVELARLAQRAEIEYAHVNCGLLDQLASSLADEEHMLFIDTRTLERRLLPLPAGAAVAVVDSGVRRELAHSRYNERRAECEEAARRLGVPALRDVVASERTTQLPAPLDRRARHVVTENARVLRVLEGVDAAEFGRLMNASHASLRDDYEVSIAALDRLVESLMRQTGVLGARLTGAGFGGACVALLREGSAENAKRGALEEYARHGFTGRALV